MLSVSGARGIVGRSMTPAVATDFASAFGSFIRHATGQENPTLCVGRDSRPSGRMLADAAVAGLAAVGCNIVRLGIVTTPSVAVMIDVHKAAGGMVVTASHNPIEWNGLKCLNPNGVAPPAFQARDIIDRFHRRHIDFAAVHELGTIRDDETAHVTHVGRVLANVDVDAIRRAKFRVVLDSVNGAGCVPGRLLLEELGCEVIHLNGEPTGLFAHRPEPTEANLTGLAAATAQHAAAIGFAQDPDADRLAIIDERGTYIGEEYTLVLAAMRALEIHASNAPTSPTRERGEILLAANLSTSRMIDDVAAKWPGARVLRTPVGEANIVDALKPHGSAALLGGEGNGGVIWPPVCWVRDSLGSMALVLSLLAHHGMSLSAMAGGMPRYAMIKHKFDLAAVGGTAAIEPALTRVRAHYAGDVSAKINDSDGVRIDLPDGWVHLRPSNTEPILRLIAEATTKERAWALIEEVGRIAGLS
jgi:phosphomannomutase